MKLSSSKPLFLKEIVSENSPVTEGVYVKLISWEVPLPIVKGNWISKVISEALKTTSSITKDASPVLVSLKDFWLGSVDGIFSKSISIGFIDKLGVLIWKDPLYESDKIFSCVLFVITAFDTSKGK